MRASRYWLYLRYTGTIGGYGACRGSRGPVLVPLVFLPGRLFSAYWYVPLIGAAIAIASLASGRYGFLAAVFLAVWLPWNYFTLTEYRTRTLAEDAECRAYVGQLQAASRLHCVGFRRSSTKACRLRFLSLGSGGALRYMLPNMNVKIATLEDPAVNTLLRRPRRGDAHSGVQPDGTNFGYCRAHPDTPDSAYITMDERTPVWQLTDGWYGLEEGIRWTGPQATARLYRPPDCTGFEVVTVVSSQLLAAHGYTDFQVRLNGVTIGVEHLTEAGIRTLRWHLPPGSPGPVEVEFQTDPPFHASNGDPRTLGAAFVSFGFLPTAK